MPNIFAYIALFAWPLVVILLFRLLPQSQAVAWSVIGGYLALPHGVGVNPPVLPTFDKVLIPALSAGIMVLLGAGLPERPSEHSAVLGRRRDPGRRSDTDGDVDADAQAAQAISAAEGGAEGRKRQSALAQQPAFARQSGLVQQAGFTREAIAKVQSGSTVQAGSTRQAAFTRQMVHHAPRSASAAGEAALMPVAAAAAGPVPRIVILLLILLVLIQLLTVAGNGDPYQIGVLTLPGLGLYDAFSSVLGNLVMVLPFLLGLFCLGAPDRHPVLLRIFCVAGLIYTLPTLFEIRMSPQLSRWTYGFLAQSFAQAMRDGGFRPVVFLQHGLWLAIFLAMAALAAFTLWRHERVARGNAGGSAGGNAGASRVLVAGLWLSGVLALCHSLGALAILMVLVPIVLLGSVRVQMLVALCITLVILTYPMLRGSGLIPTQSLQEMAASVSADREGSLKFRLNNEDQLLAQANQRPLAGWGGFGRSFVYDPETGEDLSITDGIWIIVMGQSGWLGYLATFGLLGMPVLILFWRQKRLDISLATAGLCLILTANLVDMIPNATMTPLTWLIAGALAGRCRFVARVPDSQTDQRFGQPSGRGTGPARLREPAGRMAGGASLPTLLLAVAVAVVMGPGPAIADATVAPETVTPSTIPSGTGLTDPTLAFGLSGLADWSTEMPFLDLMKTARPFVGQKGDTWDAFHHEDLVAGGYLDAQGWPKAVPQGVTSVGTIWAWDANDLIAARSRAGTYLLTYAGQGTLQLAGDVQILRTRPGRILFRNLKGGFVGLNISLTDPNHTGDYLRDIVIVPEQYEALHDAGEIFNPVWLKLIEDARALRFKDWMQVDGMTQAAWNTRPEPGDATWGMRGAPVEVMVQLANQTGTEPWFSMPAGADEGYIRGFATYVRDHLDPRLKIHIEYSNEMWNWLYPQTQWMAAQAKTVWGTDDKAAWLDYQAMLATKSALIWDKVFGVEAKARLDKVLGTQTVSPWLSTRLLTAPLWQKFDPAGYVAPAQVFNSLALTTYFGYAQVSQPEQRAALLTVMKDTSQDATVWFKAQLLDPAADSSIPQIVQYWASQKAVADQYGLKLVAYEGGQHVLHSAGIGGISDQDMAALTDFLAGFVRGPAMADLYRQLWTAWARAGDGPFMQFTDVSAASKYGAWGLYAALGDRNPRADMLMDLNAHAEAWFGDGGGPQYQQGVIRLAGDGGEGITGTDLGDFLIGGAGDDTITPGRGPDLISGGAGTDTVVLSGAPQDYHLVAEAPDDSADQTGGLTGVSGGAGLAVYRLTGPGTDAILRGIERFRFAGGISRTLDEMLKP